MRDRIIEELQKQGFDPVYLWHAVPDEEDPDHDHSFDTHLVVLDGELEIRMNGERRVLGANETIDMPRKVLHYGKAGPSGCTYIVAEKH